jgi:hypothetical protein
MTFEERMNEVRELLKSKDEPTQPKPIESPSWDEDLFRNGWPNCWGDFNNIMK